jgi:hypothetical protein
VRSLLDEVVVKAMAGLEFEVAWVELQRMTFIEEGVERSVKDG